MKYSFQRFATMLGICSLLGFLGGCQQEAPKTDAVVPQANIHNPVQDDATLTQTLASDSQQLQVSDRCIGCGKCARIASDTFVMQGGRAQVYTQEHVASAQVQQAMRICPVSAIELIEV